MSESLINASAALAPTGYFSANVQVLGAQVHINTTSLDALLKTLAQFGYKPSDTGTSMTSVGEAVDLAKRAVKQKEAAAQVEKPAASAAANQSPVSPPASGTETAASHAAAPSTNGVPSGDEPARPTYDDVKKAVLALAKISPDTAKATLAKFTGQNGQPCDHGTKLKLEDYPAFLAAANEHLKVTA